MTEKRFRMIKSKFTGMYVPVDNQHVYNFCGFEEEFTCMGFVNALNTLQQRGTENGKIAAQLLKENEQLKYQNEMLSDELQQCKAVINKEWSKYLKKKEKEVE